MHIQPALKDHARALAVLINQAGEGIPEDLWKDMVEGDETPLDVGTRRAARETGGFSYRNARVAMEGGAVLGMIIAYRQPDPYEVGVLEDYPEIIRPLIVLESRVPGSWYINAIATVEDHRGRGVASALLAETQGMALMAGCSTLSLIVASENEAAKRLYEHLGFETQDVLPVVDYPECQHGGFWLLMTKAV